jgi:predicted Rossmann fold flavoprotein
MNDLNAMTNIDCLIIGAGAAGLMCAITAGQRGRRVVVLDHANKVGKKILMSGGGRCNFTNLWVEPENYLSANPHFCKSALSRYTQYDFIALVEKHGLAFHEKAKGQLFCDNKAKDLLNILLDECAAAGAEVSTHTRVESLKPQSGGGWSIQTSQGEYQATSVVVATGGLSIPTLGATGFGYDIARQFGLQVTERAPALVPFTLAPHDLKPLQELSGVSLPVRISCNGVSFREDMLITHRGLSGPAVLQISNYWYPGDRLDIDLLPDHDLNLLWQQWREQGLRVELRNALAEFLPKRFVQVWLDQRGGSKPVQQYNADDIQALDAQLHTWSLLPAGTEGYRTAEVTRGGVSTDEVSSKTFEAKKVPGLYFVGEVLDVTGWLGGFNFQWAWASGHCAGLYV